MDPKLKELLERLEKQQQTWDSLAAELKAARESNDARVKDLESRLATAETTLTATEAELKTAKERLDQAETRLNRTPATVTRDHAERPFACFGDQLVAIHKASIDPMHVDERLNAINAKAASGGSAMVPADGGFLIQQDFAQSIFQIMHGTTSIYQLCDSYTCSENSDGLEVPYIDETSRVTGSRWGGVQIYRAAEADSVTAKKPKIGKMETRLEDLRGLAYMTDRLLRDARAMSAVYQRAFAEEFAWVIDNEIIRGTGVAQCLGVLASACLVSVTKETGQAADTFLFENAIKMLARLHSRSLRNARWFINQDVWPQLLAMNSAIGTGGQLVFLPPGGASQAPYGSLFGRPIEVIEQADTVGDQGDVILADFSQYQIVEKGGLEGASSIHVKFINHETTFRWQWSVNGQPKWKTSITPAYSSNTVSPFVALDARA